MSFQAEMRRAAKIMNNFDPKPALPRVDPIRHEGDAVGRNKPCPCGSGEKFKRCCLLKALTRGTFVGLSRPTGKKL